MPFPLRVRSHAAYIVAFVVRFAASVILYNGCKGLIHVDTSERNSTLAITTVRLKPEQDQLVGVVDSIGCVLVGLEGA